MSPESAGPVARSALASLRRFVRPRSAPERCELCSLELPAEHPHLVEVASGRLLCACEACGVLFGGSSTLKYRRVPRRTQYLPNFRLNDVQWQGLGVPISLAFFRHSTPAGRVIALYPSPGGAIEALPDPQAWQDLAEDNPVLRELEPDVEALLVNRAGPVPECFRAGLDECYKLVGLVRTHWRGLSGGPAVWEEVRRFFDVFKGGEAAHA